MRRRSRLVHRVDHPPPPNDLGQVDERPGQGGAGNPVDLGHVGGRQGGSRMRLDAAPLADRLAGYGDVDPSAVVLPDAVKRRGGAVGQPGLGAAGEHRGHPARVHGHRPVSWEIDAPVYPLPMAPAGALPGRIRREPEPRQLPNRNDSVLPLGDLPDPRRRWRLNTFPDTMAAFVLSLPHAAEDGGPGVTGG